MKKLKVHNPDNLSTIAYSKLVDFQGDLKHEIEPKELMKMRNSLIKHGVFLPKAIWFDPDGKANILDGHQTKKALASLEADGWEIPEIPYITINAKDRKDAAEKLLQINSRYAKMNPNTTWLKEFDFDMGEIEQLIVSIEIPELDGFGADMEDIPLLNDSNGKLHSQNYGDVRSDKIPINILGIGGMVDRPLMAKVRGKLLDNGAVENEDNGLQLSDIFKKWIE